MCKAPLENRKLLDWTRAAGESQMNSDLDFACGVTPKVATTGVDVGTGRQITIHGSAITGPSGLVGSTTPWGAYGPLGMAKLKDFTLAVAFSLRCIPDSDGLLFRASPDSAVSNGVALYVTSTGKLMARIHGSTTERSPGPRRWRVGPSIAPSSRVGVQL
jgi:hypothetical protein